MHHIIIIGLARTSVTHKAKALRKIGLLLFVELLYNRLQRNKTPQLEDTMNLVECIVNGTKLIQDGKFPSYHPARDQGSFDYHMQAASVPKSSESRFGFKFKKDTTDRFTGWNITDALQKALEADGAKANLFINHPVAYIIFCMLDAEGYIHLDLEFSMKRKERIRNFINHKNYFGGE